MHRADPGSQAVLGGKEGHCQGWGGLAWPPTPQQSGLRARANLPAALGKSVLAWQCGAAGAPRALRRRGGRQRTGDGTTQRARAGSPQPAAATRR